MSSQAPSKKNLGCLLGILGALIGFWLGTFAFQLHVQKILAENPKAFICGNAAFPGMFFGLIGGGFSGAVIGKLLEIFFNRR